MARLAVAIAMVVGLLLLQLVLLPAGAFAEPVDPLWALGGICHGVPDDDGDAPQPATSHDHQHCPLCQSGMVAFLVPEQTPILREVRVSLFRWPQPTVPAPRGMLRLAYASRAPPTIF
ncbi:MAG TPA: DUF2946 family protein [Acetobacteraceae bacterium]